MAAVRIIKEGMTYNPDTGSYTVLDVAGHYVGSTDQADIAEDWHLFASGSKSRGMDPTPTRAGLAGGRFYAVRRFASGKVLGSRTMTRADADREVSAWREHIGPALTVPATDDVRRAVRANDQAVLAPLLGTVGFYVSVHDHGRRGLLLGPYPSKAEAESHVTEARALAARADDRGHWYEYGTACVQARPGHDLPVGRLNAMLAARSTV
jgi:hypothetical protein